MDLPTPLLPFFTACTIIAIPNQIVVYRSILSVGEGLDPPSTLRFLSLLVLRNDTFYIEFAVPKMQGFREGQDPPLQKQRSDKRKHAGKFPRASR